MIATQMNPSASLESSFAPRRILLIKPSSLGDIVHALPVPRLLRQRWPDASISWLVNDAFADLLQNHPFIDEVIPFDRARFAGTWHNPRAAIALARFSEQLASRHFDLVLDLQGLFRSAFLAHRSAARIRVGPSDARELSGMFYTDLYDSDRLRQHAVDRYLHAARTIGCHGHATFDLPTDPAAHAAVAQMLGPIDPYAVLMPGSNWPTKRWPTRHFADLIQPLRDRFSLASVIAGGPDVTPLAAEIPATINLAGRTTLRELVALIAGASLVIANDSGPMHIAAALGRPLVALYGSTDPTLTGPWHRLDSVIRTDMPCAPCLSRHCSHRSCLELLAAEPVLALASRQLAAYGTT